MKKGLILTVMLLNVLALVYSQSVLSGTYRYSSNADITFTGNTFTGSWNATSPISGTYTVSGSRLTLNITGGPKAPNTWVWTIVDPYTLRDHDGDSWGSVSVRPQSSPSPSTAPAQSFNSPEALKLYLDRQPANSRDKPITVNVIANDMTVEKISEVIKSAGKYVNLILSGSVTRIGEWVFSSCDSLVSITIPNSVTSIERRAFSNCDNLIRVIIGDSVNSIEVGAFWMCRSLASITIPKNVTRIGIQAFIFCESLTSITVAADNNAYATENGVLYNKTKTELVAYPAGKAGSFVIPNGVTSIEHYAFGGSNLVGVTIPDSIVSIGEHIFWDCNNLITINVTAGNSAYTAENGVLYNKSKTELIAYPEGKTNSSFIIPNSVTQIGDYSFWSCRSLVSIIIPNSVISIEKYAFSWCTSLINMTIPDSVTSIGEDAFSICMSLASVIIGNGVTSIGSSAFQGCDNLSSVTFQGTISSSGFDINAFYELGDLRAKYLAGGRGTYKRTSGSSTWVKQ